MRCANSTHAFNHVGNQSCQILNQLKRCTLEIAVLICKKKIASLILCLQNTKYQEISTESIVTSTKQVRIRNPTIGHECSHVYACIHMYKRMRERLTGRVVWKAGGFDCNTLQHTVTHCSTLQYTTTQKMWTASMTIQGGKDPQDAPSYRSFLAKEPLIMGLFCEK